MVNTTTRAWGSPGRYIQGPGELMRLAVHTKKYGKKIFAVIDEYFFEEYEGKLRCMYKEAGGAVQSFCYHTEITKERIEECLRTIMQNGRLAKLANENGIVTEPLEAVIEANTLMSGLGFENVGCAAAHCICNGLSSVPGGDKALHGEKVAFGVICQLLAENAPVKEIEEVIQFNLSVGLPVTLKDMGIESNEEMYEKIAGDPARTEWQREPFYTNARIVADIVKYADELGKCIRVKY